MIGKFLTSLTNIVIAHMLSGLSTKRFYQVLNELEGEGWDRQSINKTCRRLVKNGYVNKGNTGWEVTKQGREFYQNKNRLSFLASPFKDGEMAKLLIAFDIPEASRKERNWLRAQLKIYGYVMVQKSLWRGPGPLPKRFKDRLTELNLKEHLQVFTITPKKI